MDGCRWRNKGDGRLQPAPCQPPALASDFLAGVFLTTESEFAFGVPGLQTIGLVNYGGK